MAKMNMKMAMAKYEGSKKDMKEDKSAAKKSGMSMKKYEDSPADMKKDKAGAKAMMKKGGMVKKGKK
jgi:hypothetical protein